MLAHGMLVVQFGIRSRDRLQGLVNPATSFVGLGNAGCLAQNVLPKLRGPAGPLVQEV